MRDAFREIGFAFKAILSRRATSNINSSTACALRVCRKTLLAETSGEKRKKKKRKRDPSIRPQEPPAREPARYNLMYLMIFAESEWQEREWRTKVVVFLVRPMFSWPRSFLAGEIERP